MRKLLTLSSMLLLTLAAFYFTACNNNSSEPAATTTDTNDSTRQVIARGSYLANHVAGCIECHSSHDFSKFSSPLIPGSEGGGGMVFDQKFQLPGVLYGKNITPDSATGIGAWTDDEVLRAMTQGINKHGDTLFPLMPYANLNRMAKQDLLSIIAYLRTLKPIRNEVPKRQLMVPIAMVYPGKFLQPSVDGNVKPSESDPVKYGEYLTTFADCGTCHSPLTPMGPDQSRMFAGGYTFQLPTNKVSSANITPDSATGIGTWSEERFMNKFTVYRDPKEIDRDPGTQNTIMPLSLYAGIKDEDLKAIYAYLRTVKPVSNKVEKFPK
jgi:mono/diheme cytochrome c family protein